MRLVVHGGAWAIPQAKRQAAREACHAGALAGLECLRQGGSAMDAVVAAVKVLEDAPTLNAGVGSTPNSEGRLSLDASIMRGADLAAGAVALLPPTRHPIELARAVLEHSEHVLLVGPRALEWGAPYGVEGCEEAELMGEGEGCDTVGAVALDAQGRIVAGTSTGGTPGRHPARVGDAPLIGCGTYADDGIGGASSTGTGEVIIRTTLAGSAIAALRAGAHPMEVARDQVESMTRRTGGTGGLILLDAKGRSGRWHTTPAMCWGEASSEGVFADWEVRRSAGIS